MQIVLTIQLQQDNGTPVFTGTQTLAAFSPTPSAIDDDFGKAVGFARGAAVANLVKLMAWIAAGRVSLSGTPTVTISQLGGGTV